MAFDEWLMWRASLQPATTYLRLYTWRVGAITIGLNQKKELALDLSKLSDIPVIRRVTGGRAVYHDPSELTYAIAINMRDHPNASLAGSLGESSAAIAEALTRFLTRLGIKAQYVRRSSPSDSRPFYFHTAPCFDSVSRYEVVANSRKIIASAQRRVKETLLQHGAIKLHGLAPHQALAEKLPCNFCASQAEPIARSQFDRMVFLFAREMGPYFGFAFEDSKLSRTECERVDYRTKYVKKNAITKRDIFKHWGSVDSL